MRKAMAGGEGGKEGGEGKGGEGGGGDTTDAASEFREGERETKGDIGAGERGNGGRGRGTREGFGSQGDTSHPLLFNPFPLYKAAPPRPTCNLMISDLIINNGI